MTTRERMISILRGPGAACFMSEGDANNTINELLDAMIESLSDDIINKGAYAVDLNVASDRMNTPYRKPEEPQSYLDKGSAKGAFKAMIRAIRDNK